jgi:hypothetical protein
METDVSAVHNECRKNATYLLAPKQIERRLMGFHEIRNVLKLVDILKFFLKNITSGTRVSERESSIYSELTQQKTLPTKALTAKKDKQTRLLCVQSILSVSLTTLMINKKDQLEFLCKILYMSSLVDSPSCLTLLACITEEFWAPKWLKHLLAFYLVGSLVTERPQENFHLLCTHPDR